MQKRRRLKAVLLSAASMAVATGAVAVQPSVAAPTETVVEPTVTVAETPVVDNALGEASAGIENGFWRWGGLAFAAGALIAALRNFRPGKVLAGFRRMKSRSRPAASGAHGGATRNGSSASAALQTLDVAAIAVAACLAGGGVLFLQPTSAWLAGAASASILSVVAFRLRARRRAR